MSGVFLFVTLLILHTASADPFRQAVKEHESMDVIAPKDEVEGFLEKSYDSDLDELEQDLAEESSDENTVVRKKRSFDLNIPGYDPYIELIDFRDSKYLSRTEEKLALAEHNKGDVVALRFETASLDDLDSVQMHRETSEGEPSDTRKAAEERTLAALTEAFETVDKDSTTKRPASDFIEKTMISNIHLKDGIDEYNRTEYRVDVLMFVSNGNGQKCIDSLPRDMTNSFAKVGHVGSVNYNITDLFSEAYTSVQELTVFQATIRLSSLPYMPQFEDLNNTATLKITNAMTLLTRPMFRYCFGEFFFRSLVFQYGQGPLLSDTIVFMAFLLEASEYNIVDVDTVFKRQAATGILGEYPIDGDSFIVYDVQYVPSSFKQFLVAEVTRAERVLDTVEFLTLVGIPAFFGMLVFFFLINVCAWEGFFCKLFFEDEPVCTCCRRNDDEDDDDEVETKSTPGYNAFENEKQGLE